MSDLNKWFLSLLTGIFYAVLVMLLGGPGWAAFIAGSLGALLFDTNMEAQRTRELLEAKEKVRRFRG